MVARCGVGVEEDDAFSLMICPDCDSSSFLRCWRGNDCDRCSSWPGDCCELVVENAVVSSSSLVVVGMVELDVAVVIVVVVVVVVVSVVADDVNERNWDGRFERAVWDT